MTDIQKLKESYYFLVNAVKAKGTKRDKRHGNYYDVKSFDDYSLTLDSYNSSIYVFKDGKYQYSLGSNWGGLSCNQTMMNFWIGHICTFKPTNN